MSSSLPAIVYGLGSAACWGAGDFAGGLASKRTPVVAVLVLGQVVGVALIAGTALIVGEARPPGAALGWGVAAGAGASVGLAALYRGLAVGRMAVVAPVSAVLSAAIPVVAGALAEGLPGGPQLAGFGLALAGIWLVARGSADGDGRGGLGLALVAGCGFGAFLVLMSRGAEGGTLWPLAGARATSLALVALFALARRTPLAPARAAAPLAVLAGVLDAAGNALFVLASQAGRLDVAGVLSSLYPATTVLLAAVLLRERVSVPQGVGIAAVLGAIALIA